MNADRSQKYILNAKRVTGRYINVDKNMNTFTMKLRFALFTAPVKVFASWPVRIGSFSKFSNSLYRSIHINASTQTVANTAPMITPASAPLSDWKAWPKSSTANKVKPPTHFLAKYMAPKELMYVWANITEMIWQKSRKISSFNNHVGLAVIPEARSIDSFASDASNGTTSVGLA